MPFKVEAKIEGLDDVMKRLGNIAKESTRNKILRPAVSKGSKIMRDAAKQLVPKRTGLLAKSLGVSIKTFPGNNVVGFIQPRSGFRSVRTVKGRLIRQTKKKAAQFAAAVSAGGEIIDPVKYAHLVEFGRKAVAVKKKKVLSSGETIFGRQVAAMSPRPFMRPAYQRNKDRVKDEMAKLIIEGIEKEAAK